MTNEQKAQELAEQWIKDNPLRCNTNNEQAKWAALQMAEWKDQQHKQQSKVMREHYQAWADEQITQMRKTLVNQNEPNSELFKQWDKATDENIKLRKVIVELVNEIYDMVKNLPENEERIARFKINNILIENHV